jgi:hypothetical protein
MRKLIVVSLLAAVAIVLRRRLADVFVSITNTNVRTEHRR